MTKYTRLILLGLILAGLTACGGGKGGKGTEPTATDGEVIAVKIFQNSDRPTSPMISLKRATKLKVNDTIEFSYDGSVKRTGEARKNAPWIQLEITTHERSKAKLAPLFDKQIQTNGSIRYQFKTPGVYVVKVSNSIDKNAIERIRPQGEKTASGISSIAMAVFIK